MQVLSHVAERLDNLHEAGWVHRDIKPGNVMFLLDKKRWTLIDFGCAAKTGTHAKNMFTICYAAPEVLRANRNREKKVLVTKALDAWSLGILALEMFRGEKVFGEMLSLGHEKVLVFSPFSTECYKSLSVYTAWLVNTHAIASCSLARG